MKWAWDVELKVQCGEYARYARIKIPELPFAPSTGMLIDPDGTGEPVPIESVEILSRRHLIRVHCVLDVDRSTQVDAEINSLPEFGWKTFKDGSQRLVTAEIDNPQ
jgi:hypothetical protein